MDYLQELVVFTFYQSESFVILMVDGNGIFLSGRTINSYALRPAISLKATTTVSSGNGTASNPFIITGSPYDPKVPVY